MRPKQESLNLPLAGQVADVRDKLAADNPAWGNRRTFRCFCCGAAYRRGEWKCCAPPNGQNAQEWLKSWHLDCPSADAAEGSGKRKCPRHCRCERLDARGNLPIPRAAAITPSTVKELVKELRDPNPARTSSLPMDAATEELLRDPAEGL